MNLIKKTFVITLLLLFAVFSSRARAEETVRYTLNNALYGGVLGGLIGAAVLLLTDEPDDHLGYIPTGAGVGVLLGAAYGIATSGVIESIAEVEDGVFTLQMPTMSRVEVFDRNSNKRELISSVNLLSFKF
jgi:hypothetical protein